MPVQLIPADLLARTQVIDGLRQLADYLDTHPDVPASEFGWDLLYCVRADSDAAGMTEVDRVAAVLDVHVTDDTPGGGHYRAAKKFGRITYEVLVVPARRRAAYDALMSYADAVTPDDSAAAHDSPEAA
jgi:hypothetical protein